MVRRSWLSAFFSSFLASSSLISFSNQALADAFLDYCRNYVEHRAHSTPAAQTVKALLEVTEEVDCVKAHAALTEMTFLDLTDQGITDLAPLADFHNLTGLGLSSNRVSNLWPLADLKALEVLHLQLNEIEDLTPLAFLPELKVLNLDHNRIGHVMALKDLPRLFGRGLSIGDNPISDINNPVAKIAKKARRSMDYLSSMLLFHQYRAKGYNYDVDFEDLEDAAWLLESSVRRGDLSVVRHIASTLPLPWEALTAQELMPHHSLGTRKALLAIKHASFIAKDLLAQYLDRTISDPQARSIFETNKAPKRELQISRTLEYFIAEGSDFPHDEDGLKQLHKHLMEKVKAGELAALPFAIRKECLLWAENLRSRHLVPVMKTGL